MSSFRIDRQYVSFVSAEAHSLINAGKPAETQTICESISAEIPAVSEELRRQGEQIKARLINEAKERAAKIIQEAEAEANTILTEAEKKAGKITDEAKGRAEQLAIKAQTEGYAEGIRKAEKAAEAKKKEDIESLKIMQDSLKDSYSSLVDSMRNDILSLVFGIVKKIINVKLDESDEVFMGLVDSAVEELKRAGNVAIHISSEDYKKYFGKEKIEELTDSGKVSLIEEDEFRHGDIVVESDGEILDFSVGRQLERLEKVFKEST